MCVCVSVAKCFWLKILREIFYKMVMSILTQILDL